MYMDKQLKSGIFYTQRMPADMQQTAAIESSIIAYLRTQKIHIIKQFSDLGYENLMRPGLNGLVKYLVHHSEANKERSSKASIDVVVFYSFDQSGKDKIRLHFITPKIKRYVTEVRFLEHSLKLQNEVLQPPKRNVF
ncbi:hypothetical protein [Oceanobacillus massiliensis]|uniref:hypothetical protein n=1 Tax=Oceanobacillus massiliensis TaxID=1465765 RepID=UPI000288993E|nr:hypothetical protein [Oceanobacillus massiliensis]